MHIYIYRKCVAQYRTSESMYANKFVDETIHFTKNSKRNTNIRNEHTHFAINSKHFDRLNETC